MVKMKKKIVIITAGVVVLLLAALFTIPVLFKDALLEKTKSAISQNYEVTVNFDNFSLSLIRNFPKAGLSVRNVVIKGKGVFQNDTLLNVGAVRTRFGIFDLLSPDHLTINELILENAQLNLLVNKENKANWDVVPDTPTATGAKSSKGSFGMELDKIVINHSAIRYLDQTLPMVVDLKEVNLHVKGRMYGSESDLQLEGWTDQFGINYESTDYIAKTRLDVNSLLHIDFDAWKFTFTNTELLVNSLPFGVQGNFSMPGDSIFFDLSFASKASQLSDFLKLTPPDYAPMLRDIQSAGTGELTGSFKGLYYEEEYPALQLLMKVSGGKIHYPGLPEEIKNITADIAVLKPQGDLNLTTVEIRKAHAEIRNNPLDVTLQAGNLMEDIWFNGKMVGKVDFDQLKDAIPMDSVSLSGFMNINLSLNGRKSAVENKNYELLKTDGMLSLNNFSFSGNQLSQPIQISSGILDFSPEKINLQQMNVKIGQSNMALTGSIADYYAYFLTNGTLNGTVSLNSDFLNLNELMQLQKPVVQPAAKSSTNASASSAEAGAFTIPEQINLTLLTNVRKALYDKLTISNIAGKVTTENGKLNLNGLNMNLLDGELKLAGVYETKANQNSRVNVSLDLISFDIPSAFQSLALVQKYLPIAAQSKGQFTSSIRLNGSMDQNMKLIPESLNGTGLFNSNSVQILNSPVFNKIKSVLKEEKLSDLRIDDFAASFTIVDGDLLLKPFKTKISGQDATFSGRLNSNNIIDMYIAFIINRDALSSNIENTLAILPGQQNIQRIPVDVTIKGMVKNPDVGIDLTQAKNMVKKEVKEASGKEIKNTLNKLGDGIKKLFK